jgi:hypothetical protein
MNSLWKAVAVAAFGGFISQMCGCATSTLVNIWQNPSYQTPPLAKMLVISVRKNAAKRRIFEDAFADELAKNGVAATPSYRLFHAAPPDTNQAKATVQENGFDGILAILRLPTETNPHNKQGYTSIEQDVHDGSYWQRYRTYYSEIEHPGYIDSQKVDVRLIDVTATGNGGRLVWSAISRTPDPDSITDVQRGIANLVISELARRSIISYKK